MIAVDTNVLVRYFVGDSPDQAAKARDLIAHERVFVPISVVLETEWVLRDSFKLTAAEVRATLIAFAGLPTVTVENADRLDQTLTWAEGGLEFPNALHLASAKDSEAFATFDKSFAKRANAAKLSPYVRLL